MNFNTLTLTVIDHVAHVRFNRADKANALNEEMWRELKAAFEWCDENTEVRAAVLSGEGKHFCSGIDLSMLMGVQAAVADKCDTRKREKLRKLILELQACVSSLENCSKPVIAAIHGACVGGGLDIALAADFRYASRDAVFSVREVDMGMVADVGTLQRLHHVVGQGVCREMALTGCDVKAEQAQAWQLVNQLFDDAASVVDGALSVARAIAGKSPVAVRGSKHVINYSRDHSVADGLQYIATWNAGMLMSEDIQKAVMASMTRQQAEFRD
ncbi:crotonase/enoyl-CoA hydratase family protein [Craterilacuibacter sinensis]|uniref:Crotonase/enoyl-CoA hydratase family protein n=1 Tax=Craterilacuibacter sinensis TaxID=2686017 RepID=A0A845BMM8_9NEIS|nr:crotonase/enoyl-CoA hydratase family protein [Craterilacuibacter sinensis]MXR37877.1 crotonase/enoyl-CoA hydratase family protein [Craterilacuibacter sinensis]